MRRRDEVGRLKRDCASLEHTLRSEGRPGGAGAAVRAAGGSRAFGGDGGDPEVAHRSYENMRTAELPTQQLAALQRTMLCGASRVVVCEMQRGAERGAPGVGWLMQRAVSGVGWVGLWSVECVNLPLAWTTVLAAEVEVGRGARHDRARRAVRRVE